jgi:hypothetical protein
MIARQLSEFFENVTQPIDFCICTSSAHLILVVVVADVVFQISGHIFWEGIAVVQDLWHPIIELLQFYENARCSLEVPIPVSFCTRHILIQIHVTGLAGGGKVVVASLAIRIWRQIFCMKIKLVKKLYGSCMTHLTA